MVAGTRLREYDALVLTASVWFLGKFLRYAFPPLFGQFEATYGVSRTLLGGAFTGLMLVYAAMQFPSGLLADRFGSVRVLTAGQVVTAAAAFALVVDAPFVVLAGAMALVGAGTGAYKTVAVELLSRVYPARTGRALGVYDTFGSLAGVAAPAAVVVAAGLPGVFGAPWRTLYLAGGVAVLAVAAAVAVRVPGRRPPDAAADGGEPPGGSTGEDGDRSAGGGASEGGDVNGERDDAGGSEGQGATPSLGAYLRLFRRPRFATFVAVTVLFSFMYNGVVAFLPLYLSSAAGLPSATANLLFSVLFAVSLVQLATGEVSDRVGTLPVLVGTLAAATVGLVAVVALAGTAGPLALGAAVVALGVGSHGYRPVRGAYLMDVVPDDVAGGGLGVVRTLLMVGGALSPAVVGYVSEATDFRTAFAALAAALVSATALAVLLWLLDR